MHTDAARGNTELIGDDVLYRFMVFESKYKYSFRAENFSDPYFIICWHASMDVFSFRKSCIELVIKKT